MNGTYETLNKETFFKLREALRNFLALKKGLYTESLLLADGLVIHIEKQIKKGAMYNIPLNMENKYLPIDDIKLVIGLKGNEEKKDIVALFEFLVESVINIKAKKDFNIERVTPELLESEIGKYRVL